LIIKLQMPNPEPLSGSCDVYNTWEAKSKQQPIDQLRPGVTINNLENNYEEQKPVEGVSETKIDESNIEGTPNKFFN